jgi:6-phosphofructokinase 1
MKSIAVLTSGGDAPGMNAAIRSVVRTGIDKGWTVFGVQHGYRGLITNDISSLNARAVGGIIQRGGTILGSSRCPEFLTEAGREMAMKCLQKHGIEGLIVIGGNGSQTGANEIDKMGFPVVGVASTIDNDLYGSDVTIGVDTALNIALKAIDRLKITASSHQRAFVLEVMGRDCGYLALMSGIAGGSEFVIIPEMDTDPEKVASRLRADYKKGKAHAIIVVAEGAHYNARRLEEYFHEHNERLGFELRITILGHVQRGGEPTAFDRLLATRLAAKATDSLAHGDYGVLIGLLDNEVMATPLPEVVVGAKQLDLSLLELARSLNK